MSERHELRIGYFFENVAVMYCICGQWLDTVTDADVGGGDPWEELQIVREGFRTHVESGE